jgi:hypothetical protein
LAVAGIGANMSHDWNSPDQRKYGRIKFLPKRSGRMFRGRHQQAMARM